MPRRPRIEIAGYYHIINRGVEQRAVYQEHEDYQYFLELLCTHAKSYGITVHNYCLMTNHYHLFLEIAEQNLSKFMRQLNSQYAVYFNKKYNRVGHLWQGRFKSWYVTDEAYLYTLILYIEQNPLKAKMVKKVEAYPYSSAHHFLDPSRVNECLQNAWIVKNYENDSEAIRAFLESSVDYEQLHELKKASGLVEAPNVDNKPSVEKLMEMLSKVENRRERNQCIAKAYQQGYSQHLIAKVLGLNQSTVQRIVKRIVKRTEVDGIA